MIEEHLRTFFVEADISEFITYDQVIAFKLDFQIPQRLLCLCLPDHSQQVWDRGEEDRVALEASLDAEPDGGVRLSRSGIAVHDDTSSFLDEVERLDLRQYHLSLQRQFLPLEFLEILHLREVCPVYACDFTSLAPSGHFLLQQPAEEGEVSHCSLTASSARSATFSLTAASLSSLAYASISGSQLTCN